MSTTRIAVRTSTGGKVAAGGRLADPPSGFLAGEHGEQPFP
jgi:hypothetical protein